MAGLGPVVLNGHVGASSMRLNECGDGEGRPDVVSKIGDVTHSETELVLFFTDKDDLARLALVVLEAQQRLHAQQVATAAKPSRIESKLGVVA